MPRTARASLGGMGERAAGRERGGCAASVHPTRRPWGGAAWVKRTAVRLGLESSLHPRGRPRKDGRKQNVTLSTRITISMGR